MSEIGSREHHLETKRVLALLAIAVFWAAGVTMIDPRTGTGVFLCLPSIAMTIWLYSGDFRKMSLRNLLGWPWLAIAIILIEVCVPGYLLASKADENHKAADGGIISPNNNGIVTQGQTGGMNIVNQSARPELQIMQQSDWQKVGDDDYRLDVAVRLKNPGSATKVKLTAYGRFVKAIGFYGEGVMASGGGGTVDGGVWHELLTPNAIRGFSVSSSKPEKIRIEAGFD